MIDVCSFIFQYMYFYAKKKNMKQDRMKIVSHACIYCIFASSLRLLELILSYVHIILKEELECSSPVFL